MGLKRLRNQKEPEKMHIKHREYGIVILAPWTSSPCQYGNTLSCKNDGEHAIKLVDDRDAILQEYSCICGPHLLLVVLTQLLGY